MGRWMGRLVGGGTARRPKVEIVSQGVLEGAGALSLFSNWFVSAARICLDPK